MKNATDAKNGTRQTQNDSKNSAAITQPATLNIFPHIAPKTFIQNTKSLSDEQLLKLCQRYGEQSRVWRQKFAGLLPEVNRRRLYEKKGFSSIFEFALKLAGMSENQVCRILNLERNFSDKPALHQMLINGEVSPNKLIKVAPIATKENQDALAAQVKILPCRALETLARDEKVMEQKFQPQQHDSGGLAMEERGLASGGLVGLENRSGGESEKKYQNGSSKPENGGKFDHVSISSPFVVQQVNSDFELVAALKKEVKEKLVELKRKGIDINKLIIEMIRQRDLRIEEEKRAIVEQKEEDVQSRAEDVRKTKSVQSHEEVAQPRQEAAQGHEAAMQSHQESTQKNEIRSRYIPVKIKRLIRLEHGEKCSIPNCGKPAAQIHHTQRFALNSIHDPRYLAPLCEEHHKIAHAADAAFQIKRAEAIGG